MPQHCLDAGTIGNQKTSATRIISVTRTTCYAAPIKLAMLVIGTVTYMKSVS